MTDTVSATRLYLGNLPRDVTKDEIQTHFKDGSGTISEIKLMNGFGFIEYDDPIDARDVVPDGSDLNGNRLTVQFARGSRPREFPAPDRTHPHPRRTAHRMQLTGLPTETSWQDLKDFARKSGVDVVYSEVPRERDGKGFVEFETANDLKTAVEKLDQSVFKESTVTCTADPQPDVPRNNDRYRSRSPPSFRRGYGNAPPDPYYDRRAPPPPRGYSPRRGYRQRSPREDYYRSGGGGGYRSPPPPPRGGYRSPTRGSGGGRGPLVDDPYQQPPAHGGYGRDDPYAAAPRRGGYEEPYGGGTNGYGPPRGRERSPSGAGGRGYAGYEERPPPRGYW